MLVLMAYRAGHRRTAVCLDRRRPPSATTISAAMVDRWPELKGAVDYVEGDCTAADGTGTLLTSVHACANLSDIVLKCAVDASAPVALMPCCHSLGRHGLHELLPTRRDLTDKDALKQDAEVLGSVAAALDKRRQIALREAGFEVEEWYISSDITPCNRLIVGRPPNPKAAARREVKRHYSQPGGRLCSRQSRDTRLAYIPLADEAAVRQLARRVKKHVRSIGISLWIDVENVIDADMLRALCQEVIAGETATQEGSGNSRSDGIVVAVDLREVYEDPHSRRRAHNYAIILHSATTAIPKPLVNHWSDRLREELASRAARTSSFALR
eukprot:TRINITY_DN27891_c0_g1_i3.p1 TRINITY_DN27891_c0_g1~~TRINITY_DN27891_c0_g1_i3.p1  ORF type:complete len:327 (-),score=41.40 TRINITY_DN27891_c0_g1_i3:56-1036(-)